MYSVNGRKLSGFGRDRVPISARPAQHDERRRARSAEKSRENAKRQRSKPGVKKQLAAKARDYRNNPATRPNCLAIQANNDAKRNRERTNLVQNQRYHAKKDREPNQSAGAAYASGP